MNSANSSIVDRTPTMELFSGSDTRWISRYLLRNSDSLQPSILAYPATAAESSGVSVMFMGICSLTHRDPCFLLLTPADVVAVHNRVCYSPAGKYIGGLSPEHIDAELNAPIRKYDVDNLL